MKKLLSIILSAFMLISVADVAIAQKKDNKKFKFNRLSRDVKKESKKYERDGYKSFVGQPPINQQLDKSYRMQSEADESGYPKWIVSSGSSVANTQAAAEMQAIELAKSRLVGLVETNFRAVIENTVSNNQLDAEEAVSVTKTIEVSSNRVAKKLGMIMPVVKIFRRIDKNFEVQVFIGYNYDMARKQMMDEMKLEFEKESDDVRKKYESFLNPDIHPQTIQNYYEEKE
jgi:hypothetical protein